MEFLKKHELWLLIINVIINRFHVNGLKEKFYSFLLSLLYVIIG